ncbi:MAG: hypothetical protein ACOH18_02575 [Candidatus Saccharimonadaceae bacterium]
MFINIRLPFVAATRLGNKLLVKFRSYQLVAATFITMMLIGVGSPAQAVEPTALPAADAPNFMCFIGVPSFTVFDPAKSATQQISSIILGLVIAVGFIGVIIGGIKIATAGKHTDKSADGVTHISNSIKGVTIVFAGLLVFGIIVTVVVALVPFGC